MIQANRLVIVGTGLLGASIGLGLRARGYHGEIIGVGRRQQTIDAARRRGAIDRGVLSLREAVADGSFIILVTPLSAFPAALDDAAALTASDLVITDAGSVKARVMEEAARRLRTEQAFVGSHPMAGGEETGPDAAQADLFVGKPCAIVTGASSRDAAVVEVESLWTTLGMATLRLSAPEHDAMVATISHVPHLACALLVQLARQRGGWELASTGFRDATRPASGDPPMWRDIVEWNRGSVVAALRALGADLAELTERIEGGDDEALLEWLRNAKTARDEWVKDYRKPA